MIFLTFPISSRHIPTLFPVFIHDIPTIPMRCPFHSNDLPRFFIIFPYFSKQLTDGLADVMWNKHIGNGRHHQEDASLDQQRPLVGHQSQELPHLGDEQLILAEDIPFHKGWSAIFRRVKFAISRDNQQSLRGKSGITGALSMATWGYQRVIHHVEVSEVIPHPKASSWISMLVQWLGCWGDRHFIGIWPWKIREEATIPTISYQTYHRKNHGSSTQQWDN